MPTTILPEAAVLNVLQVGVSGGTAAGGEQGQCQYQNQQHSGKFFHNQIFLSVEAVVLDVWIIL